MKIFEEDFRKERSDRERMNEEKEDLRRQVERLQGQITNLTNQVSCTLQVSLLTYNMMKKINRSGQLPAIYFELQYCVIFR